MAHQFDHLPFWNWLLVLSNAHSTTTFYALAHCFWGKLWRAVLSGNRANDRGPSSRIFGEARFLCCGGGRKHCIQLWHRVPGNQLRSTRGALLVPSRFPYSYSSHMLRLQRHCSHRCSVYAHSVCVFCGRAVWHFQHGQRCFSWRWRDLHPHRHANGRQCVQ